MSQKTIEFIPIDKEIACAMPIVPPEFAGSLDSEEHTANGTNMTLRVSSCPDVPEGGREKVTVEIIELDAGFIQNGEEVSEGSADDLLATFEGYLEHRGEKYFFSEMKRTEKIDWTADMFYPWFTLSFATELDGVTNTSEASIDAETFPIVIRNKEEKEGDEFEIGFVIKKGGAVIGSSGKTASIFDGEYSFHLLINCFHARTDLDSIAARNVAKDLGRFEERDIADPDMRYICERASTTTLGQSVAAINERELKEVDNVLKRIEDIVKKTKNPYFHHIQAVREYNEKLFQYKTLLGQYRQPSNGYSQSYEQSLGYLIPMLQNKANELKTLEEQISTYLDNSKKPPLAYKKSIEHYQEIIRHNNTIEKFLNHPAVKILSILPGSGVITGSLKLMQGKISEGLFYIIGDIVSYGSFVKLTRLARAFRRAETDTVRMMYSWRYRNMVSKITTKDVLNKITETTLSESNAFMGDLFKTLNSFKSLRGEFDSIALLFKNQKYIMDLTRDAKKIFSGSRSITKEKEFLKFLFKKYQQTEIFEVFATLRLINSFAKSGKTTYDTFNNAFKEMQTLLDYDKLPGIKKVHSSIFDINELFNQMKERKLDIDIILHETTKNFTTDKELLEYLNKRYNPKDEFGVKKDADIRIRNTRAEMEETVDEICRMWEQQKKDRSNWIAKNYPNTNRYNEKEYYRNWALDTKTTTQGQMLQDFGGSLETRISNLIEKLKGMFTVNTLLGEKDVTFPDLGAEITRSKINGVIYDIDIDFVEKELRKLIALCYEGE